LKAQIVFGAVKRLQTESESTNKIELPISLATFRANYAIEVGGGYKIKVKQFSRHC
jgi:hypothetical protein